MFTITHHHEGEYHWTVTHTDQGRTYLRSTYAMGWDKPNYPMPAIQHEVMFPWYWDEEMDWWNACHIFIIAVTRRWDDGSFTGPTVYEYPNN